MNLPTSDQFDIRLVLDLDRTATLVVTGELDAATAPRLREATLQAFAQDRPELRLDLSGVTFMDSSGLQILLAAQRRAALTDSRLVLSRSSRPVDRLLDLTGMARAITRQTDPADPFRAAAL